jgi:hydrogenase-4 transcriptional activator
LPPLAKVLDTALRQHEVQRREERLQRFWEEDAYTEGVKGLYVSDEMKRLLHTAQMLAHSILPILILGETGTGKEVLAADMHALSRRSKQPFIPFNVTAVSRDLLESQLFGARRGSFTGAVSDMKGLIREAEGGTIFLDEIGEMSLELQPKLLRFVEQGEIQPVGERPQHVDVRVIAATNASLRDLVREGRFREDLFHRLNVVPLRVPPLRDRREEIPTFVRHFVAKHAADAGKPVPDIAPVALERLVAADWPGNVRQLNNELKRIVALLPEDAIIEIAHLSPEVLAPPTTPLFASAGPSSRVSIALGRPLDHVVGEAERAAIEHAWVQAGGNVSEAARSLGVTRRGLYLKRQRLGMDTS